jgi:Tol biopolymer transport system component/tRNA A-37 threonylcarbamoyl transferase component Bud32
MSLSAGTKLGPYEILSALGSGGMGAVYKARDSRLNRLVALKILLSDRVANSERRQRFVQEAQLASSLQHPHIVVIYEIGSAERLDFISMELVRGRTLESLIPRAGMRLTEALKIAVQVADALAAAHAAGVVHRDLKPGNIMVTEEGQVKVLDFGLAKLMETVPAGELDETQTQVPTVKTEEGTVLGSAPYMSPEQVEGKNVDARSDIFSFGAILYEMLSGKRAFSGDSRMSTLAAVLQTDPRPLSGQIGDAMPREVERLVQRCLRKDLNARAQHMADLKIGLAELLEDSQSGPLDGPAPSARKPATRRLWIAAGAAVAFAVLAAAWLLRPAEQATSFEPIPLTTYTGSEGAPSFSPDGSQVAFHWNGEKEQQNDIYLKLIGGGPPLRLTTDLGIHIFPAWSPDGKSIAYVGNHPDGRRGVFMIPALGGPERLLLDSPPTGFIPAWSADGKWIAASPSWQMTSSDVSAILISVETGERIDLAKLNPALAGSREPAFSPDGRWLAYSTTPGGSNTSTIWVIALTPDGKPQGSPRQVTFSKLGANGPVWTADGREIVFQEGTPNSNGAISRVKPDGKGKVRRIPGLGYTSGPIAISRNGRMAFSRGGFDYDIWRYDLKGGGPPTKWIASTAFDSSGEYSPDGTRIVFSSNRSGSRELWVCDAEGGNPAQITHFGGPIAGTPHWSPDGRQIVFDARPDGNADIFVVNSEGGGLRRLTQSPGEDARPDWSPDGKFVYFSSNRSGPAEIWRIPSAGGDAVQVTRHGGFAVRASRDGQWLFYVPVQAYAPVWRIHPDGSEDGQVSSLRTYGNAMAVTANAFYGSTTTGPPFSYSVQALRFADGKTSQVLPLDFSPGLGLSLTPDEHYLLLTKPDLKGTDLMLVEGFR